MRSLPKPDEKAGEVFALCISRIRNQDLRQRLTSVTNLVTTAANDFDNAAFSTSLHALLLASNTVGKVTKEEMIGVYTGRMAAKGMPGRPLYEKLVTTPVHGKCPLCGIGQVTTLDHHLPKSRYPILVVTPTNLVPSCTWCQTSKKEAFPKTAEEETLHPYYDNLESSTWLKATVVEGEPASFIFDVDPPSEWPTTTVSRVRHHMAIFKLARLYTSNAGSQLASIRSRLTDLYNSCGIEGVKSYLSDDARSYGKVSFNSWQSAMYRAAASSNWFCSGGFRVG